LHACKKKTGCANARRFDEANQKKIIEIVPQKKLLSKKEEVTNQKKKLAHRKKPISKRKESSNYFFT